MALRTSMNFHDVKRITFQKCAVDSLGPKDDTQVSHFEIYDEHDNHFSFTFFTHRKEGIEIEVLEPEK